MINSRKPHASRVARWLQNCLRLDFYRAFYGVVLIMVLTPLAFVAYLFLNANMLGLDVFSMMAKHPATAVLAIVAGLDITVGYTLWMARNEVFGSRQGLRIVMTMIMLQQLAVSNFVVAGGAAMALVFSRELPAHPVQHRLALGAALAFLTVMYGFCLYAFARLMLP
ncbi:hypothetical protein ACFQ5J_07800 [Lacticaseibacillus baoqingensis]|uniref:Uncharacterized protein n=1 Tax=Lacticaseibacillus baoqingensis TaxID=2486013 RepID=A0ABW4E9I6_9LACO|nr:hypothetical protein [Lacticaseibacillus baoqingensis]